MKKSLILSLTNTGRSNLMKQLDDLIKMGNFVGYNT